MSDIDELDALVDDVARSVEVEQVGAPYRLRLRNSRLGELRSQLDVSADLPRTIPRFLHQIWIGPHDPPWRWIDTFRREFTRAFPAWEYRLWREADLDALPMVNREWYDRETAQSGRANIARYEILLRYGGVYVDADIAWVNGRPFDDLRHLADHGLFAGWEDRVMLANSLIGSAPGNAALRYVVRTLHHTFRSTRLERELPTWIASGPRYFSEAVRDLPITRFPRAWFYPVSWRNPPRDFDASAYPDAYTVHFGYSTNGHAPAALPPRDEGTCPAKSQDTSFTAKIARLTADNPGQMSAREYAYVADVIRTRSPCRLLVFGVGRDSLLWIEANAGGRTVFLEDSLHWLEHSRAASPGIEVYRVAYGTRRSEWRELLARSEHDPRCLALALPNDLPKDWDVILVDAPGGWSDATPGRMQSLFAAADLAARTDVKTDVLVHDCHREVEAAYADRFLGSDRRTAEVDSLRRYTVGR